MKEEVVLKDGKWLWPAVDKRSWQGQNDCVGLVDAIAPYLTGNRVMVQAGGNCGFILSTFLDRFDTIYTFEPDPLNFYCLNHNVTDRKVIKMQACLGFDGQTVSVRYPEEKQDVGGCYVVGPGFIPTLSIDSLNLPACDLVQFDMEGYELKALYGAEKTIAKYRPVVCVEAHEGWLNRQGNTTVELMEYLNHLGYTHVNDHRVDKIFVYERR